jgi:hypothetical protein
MLRNCPPQSCHVGRSSNHLFTKYNPLLNSCPNQSSVYLLAHTFRNPSDDACQRNDVIFILSPEEWVGVPYPHAY